MPAPLTTLQDVEIAGTLPVISATADTLEASRGGAAETAERHEILSVVVLCSFTLMVSVGVVGCFLETCLAFIVP